MKRDLYKTLLKWKSSKEKLPLVIMGARQVGKTYLVNMFGKDQYQNFHVFNFQESPDLRRIFKKDYDTSRILTELAIIQKRDIDEKNDLIFFDEIQNIPGWEKFNIKFLLRF